MDKTGSLSNVNKVRVRFAPSPTGFLHLGGARTALFNYLFAKKNQGVFVLRIEDTDEQRSKEIYKQDIIESFKWLGIKYDEIYIQSERKDIYKKYLEKLFAEKKCYYCFCSQEEIEAIRQDQLSRGEAPHYIGQCYNLSAETVTDYLKNNKQHTIRLKNDGRKVVFNDIIRGRIEFETQAIGDFVIAKNSATPLYNFAVVIDDYEMNISHIIRGEEHISNTPRQILIQRALGIEQPQYAHLPLLLGADKSKLGKRHCVVNIADYRNQGYYPEALINFIALLGWNPGDNQEIFTLQALINNFSFNKVQKAGAVCNIQKLDWLNRHYLRQQATEEIVSSCVDYLLKIKVIQKVKNEFLILSTNKQINIASLQEIILFCQERLKKISDINEVGKVFFQKMPLYDKTLLLWKNTTETETLQGLMQTKILLSNINDKDWTLDNIKKTLFNLAEKSDDKGKVLWPLRVALSGEKTSPPPFDIAYIFKKEETIHRIEQAIALLTDKKIQEEKDKERKDLLRTIKNKLSAYWIKIRR